MSDKAKTIKERYIKGYVRDDQLDKYFELGVITKKEYDTIKKSK